MQICIHELCSSPGGTNNIVAYRCSTLPDKVEALPLTSYVVGDNAYTPTEHVLVPFSGPEKEDPGNYAYNYHLSQLRIRIEVCFGRLVSKWRIFKSPLCINVTNATRIIYCCTRLHDYCSREGDVVPEINPEDPRELPAEYYTQRLRGLQGQSQMRELVLEKVNSKGSSRALHNKIRNDC